MLSSAFAVRFLIFFFTLNLFSVRPHPVLISVGKSYLVLRRTSLRSVGFGRDERGCYYVPLNLEPNENPFSPKGTQTVIKLKQNFST